MPVDFVKRFRPPDEISRMTYDEVYIERMKVEEEIRVTENEDRLKLLAEYHERLLACGPNRIG